MASPYNPIQAIVKDALFRVWPSQCLVCDSEGLWLCCVCRANLIPIRAYTCPFCNKISSHGRTCSSCRSTHALNGNLPVWYYREPLKTVIHRFKYQGITAPAEELATFLAQVAHQAPPKINFVASVPSTAKKWCERGFNQSELLARALARRINAPFTSVLRRDLSSHAQVGLTRKERFANVAMQFRATRSFQGERVLIVDDVITTGATLNACATALKAAGCGPVWAVTLGQD